MQNIQTKLSLTDWKAVSKSIDDKGFALISKVLSKSDCDGMIERYNSPGLYRKTVVMERYRFGAGEYKYFSYPLPDILQSIREITYPYLVPLANHWMNVLKTGKVFPDNFEDLQQLCHDNGQVKSTVLMLKYGKGGHNTLHQDLYGEIFFPFQLVLFLNTPGKDYSGGEFVLMQQTPRAQSKAIVLQPAMGDMLLFTTNFRPVKGNKGYYRANIRHGVSEVSEGSRHTVGIIFHDAVS